MFNSLRRSLIILSCISLFACVSQKSESDLSGESPMLQGIWQIEDIDQGGVIDYSMLTIAFLESGRVSGSTGCNRFSGNLKTQKGIFDVSKIITTRRACPPATANQEQRFLAAMNDATYFKMETETWLVIYDATHHPRLKLIEITPAATQSQDIKADKAPLQVTRFHCDQLGEVRFRFVGPETIEVSTESQQAILQRQISASGTKYASTEMTFWNKGNNALLSLGGNDYQCFDVRP